MQNALFSRKCALHSIFSIFFAETRVHSFSKRYFAMWVPYFIKNAAKRKSRKPINFFCNIKLMLQDSSHKKKRHVYQQYFFKKCCKMRTLLQKWTLYVIAHVMSFDTVTGFVL